MLSQVVKVRRLSNQQIGDAYQWFLEDAELRGTDTLASPSRPSMELPEQDAAGEAVKLDRIDTLSGVNALSSQAVLTFGPNLTVIYGRNGAGKSGFARLLGQACFSRNDAELLTNVYEENGPREPSALFHVTVDGQAVPPIQYPNSLHLAKLRHIAVFDSDVARRHVSDPMSFEFRPAGFDVFHEMAAVQQALSHRLEGEVEMRSQDNTFAALFTTSETSVADAIRNLGTNSDLSALEILAMFGPTEEARLADLDNQIRAIENASPAEVVDRLTILLQALEALKDQIVEAETGLSPERMASLNLLIERRKTAAATVSTIGAEQFRRPFLNAVGTAEWQAFVHASHDLAKRESEQYPRLEDARCLLCEQSLTEHAIDHISRLFSFAQSDAQREFDDALSELSRERAAMADIDLTFYEAGSARRAIIETRFPGLSADLTVASQHLARAREEIVGGLEALTLLTGVPSSSALLATLENAAEEVSTDIARFTQADRLEAFSALLNERNSLRDRQVLSPLLPSVQAFVRNANWVAKATEKKALLSTRAVTEKEKSLFGQLITGAYRGKLGQECEALGCTLPVELRTVGRTGETRRSLELRGGHKPEAILSEGEKTALALADFLTEIGLNPARGGIVLDDPVTSLDYERKQLIAQRLVMEAHVRQVIVFTHDLVFLNQIVGFAEVDGVNLQKHWVDRDSSGPGIVTLNDSPATSKDYEDATRAQQQLARANTLRGSERERAVREGMGELRRVVEEVVAKRLLKNVVPRWADRVIVTTLPKINWDNDLAEKFVSVYEQLSRYITGHTHSEEAMAAPPEPSTLQALIQEVQELIRRARPDRAREARPRSSTES